MQKTQLANVIFLSAALTACAAPSQTGPQSGAAAGLSRTAPSPAWLTPAQLDFRLKQTGSISAWRCIFSPSGTIHLQSLASDAGRSELLLVGGYALAVRGAVPLQRDILELVDDIMMNQQLAARLLQQAAPQGPESVISTQPVRADDDAEAVGTETTNSARYYYPPWKLRGELRRTDVGSIAFDLQFDAHAPVASARSEQFLISGTWQQHTTAAALGDDFSLAGWSVYRLRMGTRDAGGITIAAYVAVADSRRYQTLGELRAALPNAR